MLLATAEPQSSALILVAVLLGLAAIYLASQIAGELASRLGLPPVLGELVGGVMIGGSALRLLIFDPDLLSGEALTSLAQSSQLMVLLQTTAQLSTATMTQVFAAQSQILSTLAEMGVIILLFEIGLESDLPELIRVGPKAATVATIGVVVPFAAGTLGLCYGFGVPLIPAVFAGAALTATSIGITARVLAELQTLNTAEGQIIIGAAVLDDILGIMILAVVVSLAETGEIVVSEVAGIVLRAVLFLGGAIILGRLLSPYLVSLMANLRTRGNILLPSLVAAFGLAYISQVIGLEAILGAFAMGLILAETDKRHALQVQIRPIADLLVPVFFVSVGAQANLGVLDPTVEANRSGLIIAVFLIAVAILGKLLAGWGAWGAVNRYAVGVGMIPRGEVGLVFAGLGSSTGILSDALNTSLIVMVIVTTFIAPIWLRRIFETKVSPAEMLIVDEVSAAVKER